MSKKPAVKIEKSLIHSCESLSREFLHLLSRNAIHAWIQCGKIKIDHAERERILIQPSEVARVKLLLEKLHGERCAKLAKTAPEAADFRAGSLERARQVAQEFSEGKAVRELSPALCSNDCDPSKTRLDAFDERTMTLTNKFPGEVKIRTGRYLTA